MGVTKERLERFEANRRRLFGLAYRMLGEASEADDVVQDAYLRWERNDTAISPEAWLTKVVTNLCLNRLTSARARREQYVGTWLPEPVLTEPAGGVLGPLETVEQRESLSLGMLVLLERLTPPERAVFVLREAFGHSHREIAEILELDEVHARQLYRRAQQHVGAERRRFDAAPDQHRKLLERFLEATLDGDVPALERMLADDVVIWSDGGGKAPAARRPVAGRTNVLRALLTLGTHPMRPRMTFTVEMVNGGPALMIRLDDRLAAVVVPELDGGRIAAIHGVTNPDKLSFAASQKN
jgi:RNA polymerase sigma-70 factor (TIGR02957 family)